MIRLKFFDCEQQGSALGPAVVLVIREKALMGTWRDLPLSNTYWPTALEFFLETGRDDIVFVAPKRDKNFRALLEGLDLLRREGIAEPV